MIESMSGELLKTSPEVEEKPDTTAEGATQVNKYSKVIKGAELDVYDVLKGFEVINPATQHAIKKLLMAGKRGIKDVKQDLSESIESIKRAIELETSKF